MSHWTYIDGTIKVEVPGYFRNCNELKEYVEYVLKEIKKRSGEISGSEGPAEIFINTQSYPSMYSSNTGDGYTRAYLTIQGSLRDRFDDQTESEFKRFFNKLCQYVEVEDVLVRIRGINLKIFTNKEINSNNTETEVICDPLDLIPDDEYETSQIGDKISRIRQINHEKYIRSLLTEAKIYDIKWLIDQLPLDIFEDILQNEWKLDSYSLDVDFIKRRLERKFPVSQAYKDYLSEAERDANLQTEN